MMNKNFVLYFGLFFVSGVLVLIYMKYDSTASHINRYWIPATNDDLASCHNPLTHELCDHHNTSLEHCNTIYKKPGKSQIKYPIQMVSGMPGSGNDWILWLGSVIGYEGTNEELLHHCEVYHGWNWMIPYNNFTNLTHRYSNCVYIKTHEPYFWKKGDLRLQMVHKAAVILRHPFDAVYSEYKRQRVVSYHMTKEERENLRGMKSSSRVNITDFLKQSSMDDINKHNVTIAMRKEWLKLSDRYIKHWEIHAQYWLREWEKPIRPIIYPEFKENVRRQLPELLLYFGQPFDTIVLDKFCCVIEHPYNPELKRQRAPVDRYKEYIFHETPLLQMKYAAAVNRIQSILDKRWPNRYKISRG